MSNFIPRNIECIVSAIADAIPKYKILLIFFWFAEKLLIICLLNIDYLINKKDVRNMDGLKTSQLGYGLSVLLIEAPPSM